ncbi:MAG: asparagine synthase-related protein, partial [Thermoproteota archaeon]|nr:asparagine synthase-related protein [Thermoproteota archaeon]
MGAIVAILNKEGENAASAAVSMLKELGHRGGDAYGVGSPTYVVTGDFLDELNIKEVRSNIVLGHNFLRFSRKEPLQPFSSDGCTFVFEGQLFPSVKEFDAKVIAEKLKSNPERGAEQIIRELKGSYVFAVTERNKILVGRDPVGATPLYYGENNVFCAVASERKALWKLDLTDVRSFPPGNLATLTKRGFSFKPVKTIQQLRLRSASAEKSAEHLQKLLLRSTYERVSKLKEVAVAFSGGLDSSLLAVLAKKCTVKPHLISVGLKGHNELQHAKKAVEVLDLPFHFQLYTEKDVEKVLPKVLWLIEEPDFIKTSVAIPIYWSAELASKLGFQVLLAGQGSDELFGGYHKYLREHAKAGIEGVQKAIYYDVVASYNVNFQRDEQVCAYHKVKLHLPFADWDVVNFGLSLPVNLKVKSPSDSLRKHILRQVAKNIGFPSFIVNKRKKAIQYATGTSQALKKLAKKEKL